MISTTSVPRNFFFDNVLVLLFPWVGLDPLTSPVFSSKTYQFVENQSEIDMH